MWKTCQEARPKNEVMTPHNTPLTSLYPQRYLADFSAGLGILIIGGNKFPPTLLSQKRPRRVRPFPCSKRFWETDDAMANIQTTNSVEYQGDPSTTSPESATIPHSHPRGEGGTRCSKGYLSRAISSPVLQLDWTNAMPRNRILPAPSSALLPARPRSIHRAQPDPEAAATAAASGSDP